ncbi:MAG TPA: hypothetical protein VKH81_21835 [Candidatus Angelobacter sp.]|nr:hypothetical protein [Candidatus Angelobacter sp.]
MVHPPIFIHKRSSSPLRGDLDQSSDLGWVALQKRAWRKKLVDQNLRVRTAPVNATDWCIICGFMWKRKKTGPKSRRAFGRREARFPGKMLSPNSPGADVCSANRNMFCLDRTQIDRAEALQSRVQPFPQQVAKPKAIGRHCIFTTT